MSFSIFDSTLILCTCETILVYEHTSQKLEKIQLPKLPTEKDIKQHNNFEMDAFRDITSVSFSSDGKYFSVWTNRKQLCLYKTKDASLVYNKNLTRAASQVRFTPNNDIIVADKSGDVYIFTTCDPRAPGTLVLGHLSMLLDILVTEDQKYIVSADRDEKIRISHFPNCYNIQSFCLGHKAFVSNISELPVDKKILVSAGGDGQIKFWNYAQGSEIKSVGFMEKIEQEHLNKLNDSLKELELQENNVKNLPVKHLRLGVIGEKAILVASFYGSEVLLIYGVSRGLEVEFLQKIIEDCEPLECVTTGGKLWILFNWGIKVYAFHRTSVLDSEINNSLHELNRTWEELRCNVNAQTFYPILYKRKFDNIQEYHERKQSRLKLAH